MSRFRVAIWTLAAASGVLLGVGLYSQQQVPDHAIGYTDTPVLPGQKWKVHDAARPKPVKVDPGRPSTATDPGKPPSDAIVLFDGKNLDAWQSVRRGQVSPARWKVENGYFESVPRSGDLVTKDRFGDCQLHIEYMHTPGQTKLGQDRGNSGVIFMGRYEIQVLESNEGTTYADGQAGSIYGQFPPLVNPARPPGQWNVYDIVFEAPKFEGTKLVKPAFFTVFMNGVVLHNRQEAIGPMAHRVIRQYSAHAPEEPLLLQDHNEVVRFRNVWLRRLKGYDAQ